MHDRSQSTRHWAEDALWFDIPPFASRGVQPALNFFDRVFSSFQSCKADILEMDVVVNGIMGLVCTIQKSERRAQDGRCENPRGARNGLLREAKWRVEIDSPTRLRPIWRRLGRQNHHGLAQRRESEGPQRLRLKSQQHEGLTCPKYGW